MQDSHGDCMPKTNWREFLDGKIKIKNDATRRSKYREIRKHARKAIEDLTLIAEAAVEPEHAKSLGSLFHYEMYFKMLNPMMNEISYALDVHKKELHINVGRMEEALAIAKIPYNREKLWKPYNYEYLSDLAEKLKKYEEKTGKKFSYGYEVTRMG